MFSERIRWLRKIYKLTQGQLAEIVCIDRTTVAKWESGENIANKDILNIICDNFHLTIDYLLGRTEDATDANGMNFIQFLKNNPYIASGLLELREVKNLTQNDIAEKLNIPLDEYIEWENRNKNVDFYFLFKLAKFYNKSINYMVGYPDTFDEQKKLTGNPVSFEKFSKMLNEKGLTEKDIENLSKDQLSTIADIIKNFKQ